MQDFLTLLHPVHQHIFGQTCKKFRFLKQECSIGDVLEQGGFYLLEDISDKIIFENEGIVSSINSLLYVKSRGYKFSNVTCEYAAKGHLESLKYLHENGCPWNEKACSNAAEGGYLECLKYLHENGWPWNGCACSRAAQGHLECLKYLHDNGCLWDEWACEWAAQGHLECLKYLHENGCSWNGCACSRATQGN
jgi:hypothetical protein